MYKWGIEYMCFYSFYVEVKYKCVLLPTERFSAFAVSLANA